MKAIQRILVTGSAGFIGHHLSLALQQQGHEVVGIDSLNSYYDPELKYGRLKAQGFERSDIQARTSCQSRTVANASFVQLDLADAAALQHLFAEQRFDVVINLAAQAGVRHSIDHPEEYVSSNLVGFANLLECCRHHQIKHLLFASSSSVYGLNEETPFRTSHRTDAPISFYAATKKANEAMAHSYAHLYRIPTTGLRFFTVYGPWGRPDMAYYSFAKAIVAGQPIRIFNHGDMLRDFTYVDDVVESIVQLLDVKPALDGVPYKIYNIGNHQPEPLLEMVATLERLLQRKARLDLQPMQPGDVQATYADVEDLMQATGFRPRTSLEQGLRHFVTWFKAYHQVPEVQELKV
ncbi:NAD-dependent epimerase/dehydratase family protein [Pontibacter mangrovi]|uniref:NAD-dependent epimerase/dehydratase family protein n=1 Tax=Pontibacter mangrovi TaxID=2589816 RepID=A0A501W403_9BACT|nr:NAD-dependent epimerase/dehydratase family protein [Pontibacter mangrovi]TPE43502.1 NAD-dependent epimerase/dehydratase family protein [Pontibacter mangrovi]